MLWMIIERFKDGDPVPVYRRFREKGRLASEALKYIGSWVSEDMTCCYQVMECEDRRPLDEWLGRWSDLVRFEVVPVITTSEVMDRIEPRL
jgi:hypothetical protein